MTEDKKEKSIRRRVTYRMFKEFGDFLKTTPETGDILEYFHNFLNSRHLYGSNTLAETARESLDLAKKDLSIEGNKITI